MRLKCTLLRNKSCLLRIAKWWLSTPLWTTADAKWQLWRTIDSAVSLWKFVLFLSSLCLVLFCPKNYRGLNISCFILKLKIPSCPPLHRTTKYFSNKSVVASLLSLLKINNGILKKRLTTARRCSYLYRSGEGRTVELDVDLVDAYRHAVDHLVDEVVLSCSAERRKGLVWRHRPQLFARLYVDVDLI